VAVVFVVGLPADGDLVAGQGHVGAGQDIRQRALLYVARAHPRGEHARGHGAVWGHRRAPVPARPAQPGHVRGLPVRAPPERPHVVDTDPCDSEVFEVAAGGLHIPDARRDDFDPQRDAQNHCLADVRPGVPVGWAAGDPVVGVRVLRVIGGRQGHAVAAEQVPPGGADVHEVGERLHPHPNSESMGGDVQAVRVQGRLPADQLHVPGAVSGGLVHHAHPVVAGHRAVPACGAR
jgi:hypothetical protein